MSAPRSMPASQRPMRSFIENLPRLPLDASHNVDFQSAAPALLATLAEDAETTMAVIQLGIGAIGNLLAHSAVAVEDGTISADSLESLGFLMAELGDLAAASMSLSAHCRRTAASMPKEGIPLPSVRAW